VPYWKQSPKTSYGTSIKVNAKARTEPPTSFISLAAYIDSIPRTQRRLLTEWKQNVTDLQVWRAFRSRAKLHLATDGGLKGCNGTHGWVLATSNTVLFTGAGPIDSSSTRCELGGLASSLLTIAATARIWGLRHKASLRWYADSKAANLRVNRFARHRTRSRRMPPDADFLSFRIQRLATPRNLSTL
jgi:hypothetical protein